MSDPGEKRFGAVEGAVVGLFSKSATVTSVTTVSGRFRRIALAGDALRGVGWSPGDKLQIMLGGWLNRTYTPMRWDAAKGTTELLAYLHADAREAPGAAWAARVAEGDRAALFGPRRSLSVDGLERPVLFGDETSIAVAAALRPAATFLEVSAIAEVAPVIAALGLTDVRLFERRPGDEHLRDVEEALDERRRGEGLTGLVLTGKASSIQRLNRHARQGVGLGSRALRTRAYWAPGKAGLD